MILIRKALIVLRSPEIRQYVTVAPARCAAQAFPFVVVCWHATRIDLGVDRRAATDHLRLREAQHAVLQMLLRHGIPAPRSDAFGHLRETSGHVEKRVPVA